MVANPSGKSTTCDEAKIGNNGTSVPESKRGENEAWEIVDSPPLVTAEASSASPSPATIKGKGLKKWKRIKRDGESNLDNSKLLQRGMSNQAANLDKPMQISAEVKQSSEGSASSSNAVFRSFGTSSDHFGGIGDSGLVIGPVFATGTDPENSEDRTSKSSTAARPPKLRQESREKNRVKSLNGKNFANSVLHKGHQGMPWSDTCKKQRGEVVKIEAENSHSSMESDSRTSHSVFVQGNYSATSNGGQSGRLLNYGETSDEAQGAKQELSEELRAGYSRKNGEFEVSSEEKFVADTFWTAKDDKRENNGSFSDVDPLVESIMLLQSVQQQLGKEVEKFKDIGKEDFIQEELSEQSESGEVVQESFDVLGSDIISLKELVDSLRSKVDNATALLDVKEIRIAKLEGILGSRSPNGERSSSLELYQVHYKDMELELERLFKQKIEAEVEYLGITIAVQKLKLSVVDQMKILEEQNSEQAQMLVKLGDARHEAVMLKGRSEKLEKNREDIEGDDETLKLRSSVCKYTSCFFLQVVLYVIILAVFFWHLPPYHSDFVPT